MILEIEVENLFSFKDKITFDMNSNIVNINGGFNSGKTSLLKILNAVSLILKKGNGYLNTFGYNDKSSSFKITFLKSDTKYVYGFTLDKKQVSREYLYYYDDKEENIIFERVNKAYTFNDKKLKNISKKVLDNRLFLSYAKDELNDVYTFLTSTIGICLDIRTLIEPAFNLHSRDINNKLKPYVLEFYKNINVNIIDYKVKSIILGKGLGYTTKFKHNIDNKNYIIDYGDESLSNRLVFAIIPFILKTLKEEKVLIIDDLDSFLDNRIIKEIINVLKDSKGQFIFSSHLSNDYDVKTISLL